MTFQAWLKHDTLLEALEFPAIQETGENEELFSLL